MNGKGGLRHSFVQQGAMLLAVALVFWLNINQIRIILGIGGIILGALLLAQALHPLTEPLARLRVPRGLTVLVVYVAGIALIFLVGNMMAPLLTAETHQVRQNGPQLW